MLQGKLAGVVVTNGNGQPGAAASIRVRGTTSLNGVNEPLYIIDGIPDNVSAAYSMIPTIFLLEAYSVRYTAAPTPRGRTIKSEAIITYSVFKISGSIPIVPFK